MKDRINQLLSLKYPTRQDMRECMWLQKEYIEQLEKKLDSVQQPLSGSPDGWPKCSICGSNQSKTITLCFEHYSKLKKIQEHFA